MSTLLRQPATVPALFSRAMDADGPAERAAGRWTRLALSRPVVAIAGWAAVMLIDVPLLKAAALVSGLGTAP